MILITGATGLIGAHLALRLTENGRPVRALYRHLASQEKTKNLFRIYGKAHLFEKIQWAQGDITDIPSLERAFENVEQVYHCAALISFNPKDEEKLRKTNIEGTANMVNLALDFGVKKFCHVSSVAALGDLAEHETVLTEETPWNPEKQHSDYAISKYGSEMEVWRAHQEGLQAVVINPGVVLGPGFWNEGSGVIFSSIQKGFPFYSLGSTGFVAVTDVVSAMEKLMESEVSGERFTLVGEHLILRDLAFAIADALKARRPSIKVSPSFTRVAIAMDWLASLFGKNRKLFSETSKAFHRHKIFSAEKILETGFVFTPVIEYIPEIVKLQKTAAVSRG